jgi:hypothetical protein
MYIVNSISNDLMKNKTSISLDVYEINKNVQIFKNRYVVVIDGEYSGVSKELEEKIREELFSIGVSLE